MNVMHACLSDQVVDDLLRNDLGLYVKFCPLSDEVFRAELSASTVNSDPQLLDSQN